MTDADDRSPTPHPRNRPATAIAAAALLALGVGAGAIAVGSTRPTVTMGPVIPVAIRSLEASGIVTVRGRVAEIYGDKFVLTDATGRALVDTGREGAGGGLVTAGEAVTVQGRFDGGFIHAAFLVGPDGKVVALGPLGDPPHGRDGHRHGPDDDRAGPLPPPRVGPAGDGSAPAEATGDVAAPVRR